nr:uncharacterized protein LOC105489480 [Macaca nemestrina]XP_011752610.1 uncharacterized protein LOC105489480 [Macaca nemestrina]XP_011752611.1 uncharacterized protein LOC105489480 [Macaca nemestrina]XP_011752612.1 uncharacterized protein LOC105489480 [Macaca nemestrina]
MWPVCEDFMNPSCISRSTLRPLPGHSPVDQPVLSRFYLLCLFVTVLLSYCLSLHVPSSSKWPTLFPPQPQARHPSPPVAGGPSMAEVTHTASHAALLGASGTFGSPPGIALVPAAHRGFLPVMTLGGGAFLFWFQPSQSCFVSTGSWRLPSTGDELICLAAKLNKENSLHNLNEDSCYEKSGGRDVRLVQSDCIRQTYER